MFGSAGQWAEAVLTGLYPALVLWRWVQIAYDREPFWWGSVPLGVLDGLVYPFGAALAWPFSVFVANEEAGPERPFKWGESLLALVAGLCALVVVGRSARLLLAAMSSV